MTLYFIKSVFPSSNNALCNVRLSSTQWFWRRFLNVVIFFLHLLSPFEKIHCKRQVLAILCNTRHQSVEITEVSYISPYLGETGVKFNHIRGDRQWSYRSLPTFYTVDMAVNYSQYKALQGCHPKLFSPEIIPDRCKI